MSLRKVAKRIFIVVDLECNQPGFLACIALPVEVLNGFSLPSRVVFDTNLDDVLGIALNGGCLRSVGNKGRYQMRTGQVSYSAHCAHISRVEAAGGQVARGFWDIVGCNAGLRVEKRLGLSIGVL